MAPLSLFWIVPFISTVLALSNPISVKSAQLLGNQTSSNDPGTSRDGGWESQIGSTYFQMYADTEHCDPDNFAVDCGSGGSFRGNTIALATSDPQSVTDFVSPNPAQLCDSPVGGYRLHMTNVVSLSDTQGVLFYQNISSDTSKDIDGAAVGSGVAIVTYTGNGSPTCEVYDQFWGDTEPNWGSHGAIGHNIDGYIYFLGSLGADTPGNNYSDVFAARVAPGSQLDINAYQYFDGTSYTSKRLTYPVYNGYAPATVLPTTPQGSISYNNYYNTFVYLYPGPPLSGQIKARTAQVPSGPWTDEVTIYSGGGLLYAPVAQPHFDTSGKTLIYDQAVFSPIYLQTVKVTFN